MASQPFSSPNVPGLRILVIEDEALIAEYLGDLLTELGHECVGPFGRLEDALHHAQIADVDAAILDLILAGENAYSVAEVLARRGIPFGFASGLPQTSVDAKWVGRPFLDKPYSLEEVRQFLLTLLQGAARPVLPNGRVITPEAPDTD